MNQFQKKLAELMDEYAHFIYNTTKSFPPNEIYGTTSQIRRSSLSVVLNYIEGYARNRSSVRLNFLEISYGSLKESKYLLHFSLIEKYLNNDCYNNGAKLADEIGAMLWTEIKNIKNNN